MSTPSRNLPECTMCRNISMLLIVLYHSSILYTPNAWSVFNAHNESPVIGYIGMYLQSFCIAAFVFVSAYLFYYQIYEVSKYTSLTSIIARKAKVLLIPYAATCVLWAIPFYLIFWKGSLKDVLVKYVLCTSPSQLWFLVMLFVLFVVFTLLTRIIAFDQCKLSRLIAVFVVLCVAGVAIEVIGFPNYFQISRAIQYAPYFMMGLLFRRLVSVITLLKKPKYICGLWIVSMLAYATSTVQIFGGEVLHSSLSLFTGIVGVLALFTTSCALSDIRYGQYTTRLTDIVTNGNFVIFLFHQQIIYMVYTCLNREFISPIIVVITAFVASISFCLALTKFLARYTLTRRLFGVRG